ncbi:hypothetical protein Pcinc_036658 [Petrolisthes cinctipes]|uniref:Uncharacterized protein n=1 Tax=Petrolisthes cinctipes TaxID=88211 RepID=A0AAE1ENG5_PETCI|nr:hypothetical protein Pcinc_036658 [Petrolisthes cinctipes]
MSSSDQHQETKAWPELEPNCDLSGNWSDATNGETIRVLPQSHKHGYMRRRFVTVEHLREDILLRGRALAFDVVPLVTPISSQNKTTDIPQIKQSTSENKGQNSTSKPHQKKS